jgi:hypothetical protein
MNDGRPLFTLVGCIQEPQVLCPGVHEQGAQLQDIADLLGHSRLATAAIYTQTALAQRLLKAYRKAFSGRLGRAPTSRVYSSLKSDVRTKNM